MAFMFRTPAHINDFPNDPQKQAALEEQWNANLDEFTQQGIAGNQWNSTNSSGITNYFNPIDTPIPSGSTTANITWSAFPGRIQYYQASLSTQDQLSLADTGHYVSGGQTLTFLPITTDPCTGASENLPYGPYGPRGWQDEYCEWSVMRNEEGKIVRIDFTCENPEYWNTLWMIDPGTVLTLYQSTLGKPQIQLADLYLYDQQGAVVTDPSTGRPAYDPLNKWNSGPFSTDTGGGAMHLTSTPNTLQTEIGLASSATLQRSIGNGDPNALICCAQFGQPHRNSDPHIGQVSNQLVGLGNRITLTNPPGLYIQMPNFSQYQTPDGSDPASYWTIVRGSATLDGDDGAQLPGNFILHASYEVPAAKGFTVSDITIAGEPIDWAGQIAQTFLMQIVATALPASTPNALACVGSTSSANTLAQPLQLFYADVFTAMSTQAVPNPVDQPMTLVSNSTLIAPIIQQGTTNAQMVLTAATVQLGPGGELPSVTFDGEGDLTALVTGTSTINYAVPGNSYPSEATVLLLDVTATASATLGLRNLFVTNYGQSQGAAMPMLLNVVTAS